MTAHPGGCERTFSAAELAEFCGLPPAVVQRWVERELLRLHQFRKLEYHVAGSLVQLSLPCGTSGEYAERMVA